MRILFLPGLLISAVFSLMGYSLLLSFLRQVGHVKPNYRGIAVANSSGILLIFVLLGSSAFLSIQFFAEIGLGFVTRELLLILLLASTTGFVGFVDDVFGSRLIGGLRGHLYQLREGRLTTGALKAIVGLCISLIVAGFVSGSIVTFLIDAGVLTLSINALNLFDLRPGRSIKVFLLMTVALLVAGFGHAFWQLWGLILPPVLVLLWADLSEQAMLGDTGSNILGAIIGLAVLILLPWPARLGVLAGLIGLHLYSERYSLTDLIRRVSVLRMIDEMGLKR